jgi:hypothetical protein
MHVAVDLVPGLPTRDDLAIRLEGESIEQVEARGPIRGVVEVGSDPTAETEVQV